MRTNGSGSKCVLKREIIAPQIEKKLILDANWNVIVHYEFVQNKYLEIIIGCGNSWRFTILGPIGMITSFGECDCESKLSLYLIEKNCKP